MDFKHIEEKMNKTISVLQENFAEVRAGRANPLKHLGPTRNRGTGTPC